MPRLTACSVPIGLITVLVIIFLLRFPMEQSNIWTKLNRIDYLGTVFLVAACVAILIPIQSGGTSYAWDSPFVIILFVVGIALTIMFIVTERYWAREPIIPGSLFMNRSVVALLLMAFFLGAGFFSLVFYIPYLFPNKVWL